MNKKRQENETIKDWLKRTSIKDDSWLKKAKHRQSVVRSADVNIVDSDIATIEALRELLKGYNKYLEDYIDAQYLYDGIEEGYLKTL